MGEIDDLYKGEAEEIDSAFLEELKDSKNHKKSFEKYLANIRKSRNKFYKNYGKFNASEVRRIRKMKRKVEKIGKFKVLEVRHFDFKFSAWERFWMAMDVWWFGLTRKVKRFWSGVFPSWMIYSWCKVRDFFRSTWRDFVEFKNVKWARMKEGFVRFGVWAWGKMKKFWGWLRVLIGKVVFWKGKKEEGEAKESGKKEAEVRN